MTDIGTEIRNEANDFMPERLRELSNGSLNGLSGQFLSSYLNSENRLADKFTKCAARSLCRDTGSSDDAIKYLGPELGFVLLADILLEETVRPEVNTELSPIFEMQLFTAAASFIIARKSGMPDPHIAYISGLLSNISYFYLADRHTEKLNSVLGNKADSIRRMTSEWEIFGLDHAEMSYILLRSSGFNSEIYEPVRYHHQKTVQRSLGKDTKENRSLCVYFASVLTNIFYEDLALATEFRKDIKNLMEIYSDVLEDTVEEAVEFFKTTLRALGVREIHFPGYFKIISWYDTQVAVLNSEFDLTQRKVSELSSQNLKYQKVLEDNSRKLVGIALLDPLTGAFNRRYLDEKLHDEFLRAKRYGNGFTVISCDIDHFKKINDTYGHGFGDTVLVRLVNIIKSALRKTDYLARIGGEEFIIVCHSPGQNAGTEIAEKLRKLIETSVFEYNGTSVPVTMSFGVADYYPEVKSGEELIRISDERLYAAKNAGRNRVVSS